MGNPSSSLPSLLTRSIGSPRGGDPPHGAVVTAVDRAGGGSAARWRLWLACAALVLLVAAVYAPALRNGFVYDDRILIVEPPPARGISEIAHVFAERHWFNLPYYRPVSRVTMVLQKSLHGNHPAPYHAFNVALAAAAALLVFALLCQPGFGIARGPAWLAAALFALHPITSDCVYPISSGRETLIPVVLSLGALVAWLRRGAGWRATALAALALALFAKEQTVVLPLWLVAADALALAQDPPGRSARRWVLRYAPVVALLGGYAAARGLVLGGAGDLRLAVFDAPQGPLLSLLYLLQTTFAPFRELVYEPRAAVWLSAPRLVAAFASVGLLAAALRSGDARTRRTAHYFALLALVAILPTANLLAQEAAFAERYGCLALAGVAGVVAAAASVRWERPRWRRAIVAGSALVLGAAASVSRGRAPAWADDLAFHSQWLRSDPQAAQPHVGLGQWFAERGPLDVSVSHYEAAIALRPEYAAAHASLGVLLLRHGRNAEALARLERAVALAPDDAVAQESLSVALARLGRRAQAESAYARALALDPGFAEAHQNLAALLVQMDRPGEAAAHYRAALAAKPALVAAAVGLAELLATCADPAVRNADEALRWAELAVRATDERGARALAALAAAHAEGGRFDAAVRWQERAAALAPPKRAAEYAERLAGYRSGRPHRAPRGSQRG